MSTIEETAAPEAAAVGFAYDLPSVTVIIPTYMRASYLPHLFGALARQVYPADRLEVVVVDNSSTDDTEAVVAAWAKSMPFPLRFHRKDNKGPAASRNAGARLATGEILAFTDSDCIPGPHWIQSTVRELRAGAGIVCGPMFGMQRESDGVVQYKQTKRDDGTYPSGNMTMWRHWFDELGGFDEQFGIYPWGGLVAGEDTDLAWRGRRAGADLRWVDAAAVGHQPAAPPTALEVLLQPVIVQIVPRLVRSIPELRRTRLWGRYFLDEEHFRFDLAIAGVALARLSHRRAPLLLVVPWLAAIRPGFVAQWRIGGARGVAKYAVLKLHGSIGDAVVLAYASARQRRVVL